MFFVTLFTLTGASFPKSEILVVSSSSTPLTVLSSFSEYSFHISMEDSISNQLENTFKLQEFSLILDLTFEAHFFQVLDDFSQIYQVPYLTLTISNAETRSPYRFLVHRSPNSQAEAIIQLIKYLNWKKFVLFSSSSYLNLQISNNIHTQLQNLVFTYVKYGNNLTQENSDQLIGKMIKAQGIKNIVIVDDGLNLAAIQNSLVLKNLIKTGISVICGSKAIYSAHLNNSFIVLESGLENAISYSNYEFLAVNNILSNIFKNFSSKYLTGAVVLNLLQNYFNFPQSFSILYYENSKRTHIGTVSDGIASFSNNFNPLSVQSPSSTRILFSIANGTTEIYDLLTYTLFAYFYSGAIFAVSEINALDEIPNFYIDLLPTDCGNFLYDPTYFKFCLSKYNNNFGIAYLTGFWYTVSYGNLLTLKSFGIDIPQISPFAQDDSVDNSTEFPNFFKLSVTMQEFMTNGLIFIKSLGWSDFVVIYTDDPTFFGQYLDFVKYIGQLGIRIVNDESKRLLPWNYTRNDFQKYKSVFQTAKDTKCRVYAIFAYSRGYIYEGLYDIGLRKGDFITLTDSAVVTYLVGDSEEYLYKRKQLIDQSFVLSYKEFIGSEGAALQAQMSKIFPSLAYLCMTYDTVSVLKEAIKFILSKGEDYEDSNTLISTIRNNRIVGCLGNIYFNKDSNSRGSAKFNMQQVRFNYTSSQWYGETVAILDSLSSQVITYVSDLQWPIDNNSLPNNYLSFNPCPFDAYQVIGSNLGKILLYLISALFFVISIAIAIISFRNFRFNFETLSKKKIITFADMIFLSYFFFQFLQIIAMGPDQSGYKYMLSNFQIFFSLNFNLYFELTFSKFWIIFYCVIIFALVWIVLCGIVMMRCEKIYESNFCCSRIGLITEYVMPILGHIGFLPIFSMLMDIFLCYDGIGNDLTQSFLSQDCTTFCYTGPHKIYAILSICCISLYIPTAIYCRPIWETNLESLNLKTKALYLSVLSVFQVVLVILNKTLKIYDQTIHGYVTSALILALICVTFILKPYNYKRVEIVQTSSLFLSFWGVLSSTIFSNNILTLILVEFLGFLLILIIGAIVTMKYPSMLYSNKGRDISTLFLFQFCKNYERFIRDPASLNFSQHYQISHNYSS